MIHRNFTAEIHCNTESYTGPVGLALLNDEANAPGNDNWLVIARELGEQDGEILRNPARPIRFSFKFLSYSDNRWHYQIGCATEEYALAGRKLGEDAKHIVGFYEGAQAPVWKIDVTNYQDDAEDPFHWDGTEIDAEFAVFHLRDSEGYRLGPQTTAYHSDTFLSSRSESVLTFSLNNIQIG